MAWNPLRTPVWNPVKEPGTGPSGPPRASSPPLAAPSSPSYPPKPSYPPTPSYPLPGYGSPPGYGYPPPYGPPRPANGLSIAALVLGIAGCIPLLGLGIPSVLAIVFGFIGRAQIGRRPQGGRGMALAGIILGFLGIAFLTLYAVLFVIVATHTPTTGQSPV